MKTIDTVLWPIVSRTWSYITAIIVVFLPGIPVMFIAAPLDPYSGDLLVVLALAAIATMWVLLLESRERFVRWRTLSLSRRAR